MSYDSSVMIIYLAERRSSIEKLFYANEPLDEIARQYQCSRNTLSRFLNRYGYKRERIRHGGGEIKWHPEHVKTLKAMWADGKSATEISALVPFTRNAVIGKVHRLKLINHSLSSSSVKRPRRTQPYVRSVKVKTPTASPEQKAKPAAPKPTAITKTTVVAEPETRRLSLFELTLHTCRWPLGHPGQPGFAFCGCVTKGLSPYCEYHHSVAYRTPYWWQ